jgi:hypothetical protein
LVLCKRVTNRLAASLQSCLSNPSTHYFLSTSLPLEHSSIFNLLVSRYNSECPLLFSDHLPELIRNPSWKTRQALVVGVLHNALVTRVMWRTSQRVSSPSSVAHRRSCHGQRDPLNY